MRLAQLGSDPLCALCADVGRVTAATVADHVTPHKGDERLFYDYDNLQSLCKTCHDGPIQHMEAGTYRPPVGVDGWPIEHSEAVQEMIERKSDG